MTPPTAVVAVPDDDLAAWSVASAGPLLADVFDERAVAARLRRWQAECVPGRTLGVRDGERWVATLMSHGRTLTVPRPHGPELGAAPPTDVTVDAITAVAVAPTHRRRGLLTAMMTTALDAARDRGDPASVLVSAEWPIYGRFGFAPAVRYAETELRSRESGAVVALDPRGRVRAADPREVAALAPAVFDRARRLRAGQVDRPGGWWDRHVGVDHPSARPDRHWLVHETDDGPDGLVGWRATGDFGIDGSLGEVSAPGLVAASATAERNLLAALAGLDLVDRVVLGMRPVDDPLRFLLADGRALRQTYTGDWLWVRLLDVPAALAARGYAVPGSIVVEVVDTAAQGFAAGRFLLEAAGDGAEARPTTRSPDLTLSADVLTSAWLGGHSLLARAAAGGVDEHRAGALRRFDAMLATPLAPFCQTGF